MGAYRPGDQVAAQADGQGHPAHPEDLPAEAPVLLAEKARPQQRQQQAVDHDGQAGDQPVADKERQARRLGEQGKPERFEDRKE